MVVDIATQNLSQIGQQATQVDTQRLNEQKTESASTGRIVKDGGVMKIAPFGREDIGRELQRHAALTQDTLVDAIESAEVAEIKRTVYRTLTRLRAAHIKEFD